MMHREYKKKIPMIYCTCHKDTEDMLKPPLHYTHQLYTECIQSYLLH